MTTQTQLPKLKKETDIYSKPSKYISADSKILILDCHPKAHITDMLDTLKKMGINQRFKLNLCLFLWEIVNDRASPYLLNNFTPITEIHPYNMGSASSDRVHRNRAHTKTLSVFLLKLWN